MGLGPGNSIFKGCYITTGYDQRHTPSHTHTHTHALDLRDKFQLPWRKTVADKELGIFWTDQQTNQHTNRPTGRTTYRAAGHC